MTTKNRTKVKTNSRESWKHCVPEKAKEVLSRENKDGTVSVLHLDNEDYVFSIDGVAIDVWAMINGKTSLEDIQNSLEEKYSPPPKQLVHDLKKFIKELAKKKLIISESKKLDRV